jgi:uncharacterized protein YbgA (DUF1722 family)
MLSVVPSLVNTSTHGTAFSKRYALVIVMYHDTWYSENMSCLIDHTKGYFRDSINSQKNTYG